MPYFVYLLECNDGSIYTGITTDLDRRLAEHKNKIGSHYTGSHGAQKIVHAETYPNRSEASKREAEIKSWRRERKMELIRSGASDKTSGSTNKKDKI
jgi:putative endonuclease